MSSRIHGAYGDATDLAAMLNDHDAFTKLDTDGDSQFTRAEFEAGRPQQPPSSGAGWPPRAQAGTSTTSTSATCDPLDANPDGTVSEIERLAGQLTDGQALCVIRSRVYASICLATLNRT